MRRPSFCLDVRFGMLKLTFQLRKGEIAGVFLIACNFTDAWLLSLNLLRVSRLRMTGIALFLKVSSVMRPSDGTSSLVRGNRRKAVFAFKGLFALGCLARFSLSSALFCCVFRKCGENRKTPSAT